MKRLGIACLLLAAGCSGGGGGGAGDGKIAGAWQYSSGPIFNGPNTFVNTPITFLDLSKDGSGTVYAAFSGGMKLCAPMLFSVLNSHTVQLDAPNEDALYEWSRPDGNTLILTDQHGNQSTFAKVAAVPAASACDAATVAASFDLDDSPSFATGLADDGTALYYQRDYKNLTAVSASNGSKLAGYPMPASQFTDVKSFDIDSFWLTCNCGGDDGMQQRTKTDTLVASFTLADFSIPSGSIRSSARAADEELWLSVQTYTNGSVASRLVHVHAFPTKTLLSNVPLDIGFDSLATDASGNLWGLSRYFAPELAQIDTATGAILQVKALPPDEDWRGMTFHAGSLYLVGGSVSDPTKNGVLARIDGL